MRTHWRFCGCCVTRARQRVLQASKAGRIQASPNGVHKSTKRCRCFPSGGQRPGTQRANVMYSCLPFGAYRLTRHPIPSMKRVLHPIIFVLAVLLVFEEWLWEALKAQLRKLGALTVFRVIERRLRMLGPWASLAVLLFPALVLFPFKLAALWALSNGQSMLGIGVLICAKVVGTGVAAYLFDIVRDNARQLTWFDRLYVAVLSLLARSKAWLRTQPAYQTAARFIARCKLLGRRWLRTPGGASRMKRKLRAAKVLFGRR